MCVCVSVSVESMDSLLDSSCLGQLGVSPPSGLQVAAQDKQSVFARLGGSCGCSRHPGGVVMRRGSDAAFAVSPHGPEAACAPSPLCP